MNKPKYFLILHGWNHDSSYWSNAKEQLQSTGLELIILDLPGFGKESLPSSDWSIPDYAKWVENYLSIKNISQNQKEVVLLGHSFGGRISAYIASKNPSWIHTLILYAAPVLYRPSQTAKAVIKLNKFAKSLIGENTFIKDKVGNRINPELKHADHNDLGKVYRNAINFDQTVLLPKINVPTHLIHGTKDLQVDIKIAKEAAKLINNSQLHEVQNEGHNIHLENPTLFYGIVRSIISQL